MSYSFKITGANKDDAADKVFAELVKVCELQKIHATDSEAAYAATKHMIELLEDDASKEIRVSVIGSLGWLGTDAESKITHAHINISATPEDKQKHSG